MSHSPPSGWCFVALIATHQRPELLLQRALPSVFAQAHACTQIVLVEDGEPTLDQEQVRSGAFAAGIPISLLSNRRTKGAAGAWNTGLDHLARTSGDLSQVFVAFLDDDDAWQATHLASANAAIANGAEVIATGFRRLVEGEPPQLVFPPSKFDAADFMIGNPGVQPTGLVTRLDRLLEAGTFDEALASCTDRDLCIRLARLPGIRYEAVAQITADHYACRERLRLCTPGSPARVLGLQAFWDKHSPEMSNVQQTALLDRARRLFNWEPDRERVLAESELVQPIPPPAHPLHLVVGVISDESRTPALNDLLSDLSRLQTEPGIEALEVLVLENGRTSSPQSSIREVVDQWRSQGVRVLLIDMLARDSAALSEEVSITGNPGERWSISQARTALQTYLYHLAVKRPGAVVWILDDDMRLDPLLAGNRLTRTAQLPLIARLAQLKAEGVDIAVGPYTGAPPLPALSTVRVQMVDLLANLRWIECLNPVEPLPDSTLRNRLLREGHRDYYYDLSHVETDRLESAFLIEPVTARETASEAMDRIVEQLGRLFAGEQIFRPLAIGAREVNEFHLNDSIHRGGNTFVFDVESLADAPNLALVIAGRPTRRSDMLWALLQRCHFGRRVVSVPLPVYHAREALVSTLVDDERSLVDDIRGFAVFTALQDYMRGTDPEMDLGARAEKYLQERLAAFRLSVHRIRGLARELDELGQRPAFTRHESALRAFASTILGRFSLDLLERVTFAVSELTAGRVRDFQESIRATLSDHKLRIKCASLVPTQLNAERIALARAALEATTHSPETPPDLQVLGHGSEGVVLTDGVVVQKVFDYWKTHAPTLARERLTRLLSSGSRGAGIYPLQDFRKLGPFWVLQYPFEPSEPYSGGHGAGLVALMADCWQRGLICRNIHPKNLRVVGWKVRLVDYGSDLLMRSECGSFNGEFTAMCRRAFLSWRCWHRVDLQDLLRESVNSTDLPELTGFDMFYEAVQQATGTSKPVDPLMQLILASESTRILDFGCGKGTLSLELAKGGRKVVAYDPDPALKLRLDELRTHGITPVATLDGCLASGPFDLVVCRRVICLLDDLSLTQVLDELRRCVSPTGRVLLALCHPLYTPRLNTLEVAPEALAEQTEGTYLWTKRHRGTGRLLREVHRPERVLRRLLWRAGFRVVSRSERATIDLNRFEHAADLLVFELTPAPKQSVSLMVKACAMEAGTLAPQIQHLVSQLESFNPFDEVILTLDSRRDGFLRQYAAGDLDRLHAEALLLQAQGWVDRIVRAPPAGAESRRLNRRWLGQDRDDTHAANGAPLSSVFAGFEAVRTRWVLQMDLDVVIGRVDPNHDYLGDMIEALQRSERAVSVAFNIARRSSTPYTANSGAGPWRIEARNCLLDLDRLHLALPLSTEQNAQQLPAWHRALDDHLLSSGLQSLRGGDHRTLFVHPPNEIKSADTCYWRMVDRISRGDLEQGQFGRVDLQGALDRWVRPTRFERFVFVITGRDVPPGRFRRCLESLLHQHRRDWGAVVIDDGSQPAVAEHHEHFCRPHVGRITFLRNRTRQGLVANTAEAIRQHVGDPDAVIALLDADDCLIGSDVLDVLDSEYNDGADLTVGSMCRTDKRAHYPVDLARARSNRGGNVWQHLRTFRKALFDQLPDDYLRLDGQYVEYASDWAMMLPLVELAQDPRWIRRPLYLHEPSDARTTGYRESREAVIAALIARSQLRPRRDAA